MKKIEAESLDEAYTIACREFGCSIRELKYEIIQYPQKGILGFFTKKAVIVASSNSQNREEKYSLKREEKYNSKKDNFIKDKRDKNKIFQNQSEVPQKKILAEEKSEILDNFFSKIEEKKFQKEMEIVNGSSTAGLDKVEINNSRVVQEIESKLKKLLSQSCFNIDTIEVKLVNNIAHIFIDGDDAALLIGKEGYRYNALSYLLFNWLNKSYGLYLKLEIAKFISTQESMIKNYIRPVVEHIYTYGWGKTKPLDGILVQIALEQLREEFPNKYVAIKKQKDGSRYIIINDFNKR